LQRSPDAVAIDPDQKVLATLGKTAATDVVEHLGHAILRHRDDPAHQFVHLEPD
jgi:hypothetical protein